MENEDYLEVDKPIPGQNYVCLSFISPDNTLKQKELGMQSSIIIVLLQLTKIQINFF